MQAIHWVEVATGLDTLTSTYRAPYPSPNFTREDLNEMDESVRAINLFSQVAGNKLTIFPVSYPGAVPVADEIKVQLPYDYYLFSNDFNDSHEFGALLHEFTHVAHFRYNDGNQHEPFREGFAVWTTVQVAKNQGLEWLYQEQWNNYFNRRNIPPDMEEYFSGGWCPDDFFTRVRTNLPYEAGSFFCTYLYETYGSEIFISIFDEFNKRPANYYSGGEDDFSYTAWSAHLREESKLYVEDIKAVTSPNVFQDFDAWFTLNHSR